MVQILKYTDRVGRAPFDRWFERLRDEKVRAAILIRLHRLALGLAGDTKSVGAGVFELRVHIGPGYRVYFAWQGRELVLLLGGGTKHTQTTDMLKARHYLAEYRGQAAH